MGHGGGGFKLRHKAEENHEAWLMTYADFITLMASFFVLIISVSEPKSSKVEQFQKEINSQFSNQVITTPFKELTEIFQLMIEDNGLERDVAVSETDKGIMLEISSSYFYDPGSAEFKKQALPLLEKVAQAISDFDYKNYTVTVEGHTDDVPMESQQFPSNWELAAARATNVVRYMLGHGVELKKIRAISYADAQPKVPNLDSKGQPIPENREINRRIVIRIERNN